MSRSGSLRPAGRLLEAAGNRRPRGMAVGAAARAAAPTEPGLQALGGDLLEMNREGDASIHQYTPNHPNPIAPLISSVDSTSSMMKLPGDEAAH
jgi:hypothetical protein